MPLNMRMPSKIARIGAGVVLGSAMAVTLAAQQAQQPPAGAAAQGRGQAPPAPRDAARPRPPRRPRGSPATAWANW